MPYKLKNNYCKTESLPLKKTKDVNAGNSVKHCHET